MLPPGDLRNCMVALSEDEHLISQLFRHRFRNGGELVGHNFGNLFVAALAEMTGDFGHAIKLAAEVLATRGHIYPATFSDVTLTARMTDGSVVRGETNITASRVSIAELMLDPPVAEPLPETLEAIAQADLITIGPGSLYTSLITNLLVAGHSRGTGQRAGDAGVYRQPDDAGQREPAPDGFRAYRTGNHYEQIGDHAQQPIFDYALVNTAPVSEAVRERYAPEGAEVMAPDVERIEAMGIRCITGDFAAEGDVLRHASDRVAATLLEIAMAQGEGIPRGIPHPPAKSAVRA